MKVVLGGHFESALVRLHDEQSSPDRNNTSHPYYMDLNRNTDKAYRDGAATFVAIAEAAVVPGELDWNGGELAESCGVERTSNAKDESSRQTQYGVLNAFLDCIVNEGVLSTQSISHIINLNLRGYEEKIASDYSSQNQEVQQRILRSYLRRFIHQIHAAREEEAFLLIGELEIQIIEELGKYIASSSFKEKLPFPDLTSKVINPDTFVDGILNFSPQDIESLVAVRGNTEIKNYAKKVREEIVKEDSKGVTQAAIDAHYRTQAGKKVKEIFEVASWLAKPLHYVPGVDAVISIAEDLKDGALKATGLKNRYQDWHMIGVKMQTVSIEDYFNRIGNRFPKINDHGN
jgi:hypothetical protein